MPHSALSAAPRGIPAAFRAAGRLLAALAIALAPLPAQARECTAHSPARTTVLVELYTSAACRACPAAERWLAALSARGIDSVIALALSVDPGAAEAWGRQQKMTPLQRLALMHRPHVLVQGREFNDWLAPAFDLELARLHALPAPARLELRVRSDKRDALEVMVRAELNEAGSRHAALYVAAYAAADGYAKASDWRGPYAPGPAEQRVFLPFPPVPERAGIAAFLQDRRSLQVLQAVALPLESANCPSGKG